MSRTTMMIACLVLPILFTCARAKGAESTTKGKVLVVVSSENAITLKNGKKHLTGFFLNELGVPLKALVDAGYEPVIADPKGNPPTMDTISDKPGYFEQNAKEYEAVKSLVDSLPAMKHPLKLSDVAAGDLGQYSAIFVPGGHAPMEDLWYQPALGKILRYMHDHKKPTVLICHGPIALLAAAKNPQAIADAVEQGKTVPKEDWPYRGYKMTVFSDAEETPNEPGFLGGYMKFHPEDALKAAGGDVQVAAPKHPLIEQDRELITGQNPFSDKELAGAFLKKLGHR